MPDDQYVNIFNKNNARGISFLNNYKFIQAHNCIIIIYLYRLIELGRILSLHEVTERNQ